MPGAARVGDPIVGGLHCHGHSHGPMPSPGTIVQGASKVFIEGMAAAREGDQGHSPVCCAGIGKIVLEKSQDKVFIEGKAAATIGTPTVHCDMAPGVVQGGSAKVVVG